MSHSLRAVLTMLTDALANAESEDVVAIAGDGTILVDSTLDDAETRRPLREAWVVLRPDGLWEWGLRRDFIRSLPRGDVRERLGETLAGPRTKRRFAIAVARHPGVRRSFTVYRRRRLRAWAAQALRFWRAASDASA